MCVSYGSSCSQFELSNFLLRIFIFFSFYPQNFSQNSCNSLHFQKLMQLTPLSVKGRNSCTRNSIPYRIESCKCYGPFLQIYGLQWVPSSAQEVSDQLTNLLFFPFVLVIIYLPPICILLTMQMFWGSMDCETNFSL